LRAQLIVKLGAAVALSAAWIVPDQAQSPQPALPCVISGLVQSGGVALPGVAVTAATPEGQELTSTSTEPNGSYTLRLAAPGTYAIRAALAAFAPEARDATLALGECAARLDFTLALASRAPRASQPDEANQTPSPGAAQRPGAAAQPPARGQAPAGRGRGGFQQLDVVANANAADAVSADTTSDALRGELQLPPGFSADAPTETLATTATQQTQANDMLLFGGRGGRGEFGEEGPEGFGRAGPAGDQSGFGGGAGNPGGVGGGRGGGPGGGPGPGGFGPGLAGMRGGGRVQGTGNYNLGGSMFDAAPYPLNGRVREQPDYVQQRYGSSIGGPLTIPHVFNGGTRTSFFVNYSGNNSRTPVDTYSTVPTIAARAGDLSGSPAVVIDPATGQPFEGNRIPQSRIDPAARSLLAYIPVPNIAGDTQNFHYSTANSSNSNDLNVRVTHVFGAQPQRGAGGGRGRGGAAAGGPRPAPGQGFGPLGRGGRGGPAQARSVLNVNVGYRQSSSASSATFPTIGGSSEASGWNVPASWMFAKGRFNNMLNVTYNRNAAASTNLYAYTTNVAGEAGIDGVSSDPFDWGIPSLSFTTVADLRDRTPSRRIDQRIQVSDSMMRMVGRHILRWGGDLRYMRLDSLSNSNPRGSFVFTGLYTSAVANGRAVAGTGLDYADFLLGYAQQASVQYGPGTLKMRGNSWSVFAQDDWRVRGSLTLNYGVRYEYVSPYYEANNHLVNLDVNSSFTAAVPVVAGGTGEFTGPVPTSLVEPDRNNIAPRVGLAWRPHAGTIVRTGFGINYNLGAYGTIAQKLAAQPPFAVTSTNLGTATLPLLVVDPFAGVESSTTTNSYGIDRTYDLGAAHIWNADVQRELPRNLSVNIGYTGTRGTSLDIQRAPNREPDGGLRIDGVQPFLWQSSEGHSTLHAISVRARKRLSRGISFGGAYTWSHAYDNASSFGAGGGTVAQNDQDLDAEWGRSSFERRHTLNADYTIELPWGTGRRWLTTASVWSQLVGGWSWSGEFAAQSGSPFTPRVVGSFVDVGSGVNGTLRANYDGDPIYLDDPTTLRFFNTDAFSVPAGGSFGTAARNLIIGPGSRNLNMSLSKNVNFNRARGVTIRLQATNVLNMVQFLAIDTVVNSPTFGQVTSVRPMRSMQVILRFRF
jgi:hypothetical protein